jgi:hypothetical protein
MILYGELAVDTTSWRGESAALVVSLLAHVQYVLVLCACFQLIDRFHYRNMYVPVPPLLINVDYAKAISNSRSCWLTDDGRVRITFWPAITPSILGGLRLK